MDKNGLASTETSRLQTIPRSRRKSEKSIERKVRFVAACLNIIFFILNFLLLIKKEFKIRT